LTVLAAMMNFAGPVAGYEPLMIPIYAGGLCAAVPVIRFVRILRLFIPTAFDHAIKRKLSLRVISMGMAVILVALRDVAISSRGHGF
jgi:hypothetical protein